MSTKAARISASSVLNRPRASKWAKSTAAAILGSARTAKKARAARRNGCKNRPRAK